MSALWPGLALGAAALLAVTGAFRHLREPEPGTERPNHSGVLLPVVLGRAMCNSAQAALLVCLGLAALAGPVPSWRLPVVVQVGALVLYAAGSLDDRRADGPRGLSGHIRSLFRGSPTTGILKLVAGVSAAVLVSLEMGGGGARVVMASVVIALSINVTNALDVRPGRALKWAVIALIPTSVAAWGDGSALLLLSYLGAALGVLAFDLRERGMLGDAGSNPLGLVVGAGLATVLPDPALLAALLLLGALQIAAETVTISRLIESMPPLRWLDRLGRR